jgi:hypothetical protein
MSKLIFKTAIPYAEQCQSVRICALNVEGFLESRDLLTLFNVCIY